MDDESAPSRSACYSASVPGNSSTPRTPMSERQQMALLKKMESSNTSESIKSSSSNSLVSPPRAPLSVVNLANTPSHLMQQSASAMLSQSAPNTPKTPIDDKLRRKVTRRNPKGETALHKASYRGDKAAVLELLQAGGDPNVVDNAGWTPLHEACNKGHHRVVRILVENGADLNMVGGGNDLRLSVLHDASRNGHLKVVKYLVAHGARTDAKDSDGDTPFEATRKLAFGNNPDLKRVARFLEDYQANPNLHIELESSSDEEDSSIPATTLNKPKYLPEKRLSLSNSNIRRLGASSATTSSKPAGAASASSSQAVFSSNKKLNFAHIDLKMEEKKKDDAGGAAATAPSTTSSTVTASAPVAAAGAASNSSISTAGAEPSSSTGGAGGGSSNVSSANAAASGTGPASGSSKSEDVYDFKGKESAASEEAASSSTEKSVEKDSGSQVERSAAEKRPHEADDDTEEGKKKRRKEDEKKEQSVASPSIKAGRSSRGNSTDKSSSSTNPSSNGKATKGKSSDRKSPTSSLSNSAANSPRGKGAPVGEEDSEGESATGLKVPPLKIVLTSNGGGGPGNEAQDRSSPTGAQESAEAKPQLDDASSKDDPSMLDKNSTSGAASGSRITRSKANQGTPGPDSGSDVPACNNSLSNTTTVSASFTDSVPGSGNQPENSASAYTDYHVKKRKLRSQVEESSGGACGSGSGAPNAAVGGNNPARPGNGEPQNDIEKFLKLRKQIEQRWKNIFPVQPKPPQGFRDYLLNRKTYLLQGNAKERLRSIPRIQPPPSLKSPLKQLFLEQENDRYNLRKKHLVEKEKLVLSVEQEILRVHGRAARALANQSLPFSFCTYIRDEEIYTPIDPQQEEKNRDIRSRYNGRLFLSWLQDVDDKWEKIKEQMVLRHHNEAESLNAVQKMDWEWKLNELTGKSSTSCDNVSPQIDDLYIPMVQVSDDFDLQEGR